MVLVTEGRRAGRRAGQTPGTGEGYTRFANFIEYGDEQRDHENVLLMQFQIQY